MVTAKLMACLLYATIFQEELKDIQFYGGLPEDEAKYFQASDSEIILKNLETWNIR